jgi:NADP-dependent 3-hydroxy acid dehydrogenase YdfG
MLKYERHNDAGHDAKHWLCASQVSTQLKGELMLKNKIGLVTGAHRLALGRAVALTWAREGAKVVVSDVNEAGGEETAKLIRDQGGEAIFVLADVGSS